MRFFRLLTVLMAAFLLQPTVLWADEYGGCKRNSTEGQKSGTVSGTIAGAGTGAYVGSEVGKADDYECSK